jgi:hypothetical protein
VKISELAKLTAENPNESLLAELRILEQKMGLVLTLVSPLSALLTTGPRESKVKRERELMYSSNRQYGELCKIMMLRKLRLSELKKLGGKLRRGQRQRGTGLRRIRMIGRMIVSTITRMLDGALDIETQRRIA